MKKVILFVTLIFGLLSSCSESKSAPSYLNNKPFPEDIQQYKIQNVNGEMVTLKEILEKHKGKKIVLDFWASWCGDCLTGLPSLQDLQEETKNVDYVFLSVDRSSERWKRAITKFNIQGDHYFFTEGYTNTLTEYVSLDWIPRYMVIDEQGIIIDAKSTRASDKEFRKLLLEN